MPWSWISSLFLLQVRQARQPAAPRVDLLGGDRLERQGAERQQQVSLQRRSVVEQRRRLPRPILLDEPQPLRRRVGERCAGPDHPRQRRALAPRRPDLLLNLTTIGQPVLRVPDRPVRTLDTVDVTNAETHGAHPTTATPIPGHIRDTKRFRGTVPTAETSDLQGHRSTAGGDRTHDLRIKS